MRFTINLATRIYLDNRLVQRSGWAILVILVLLLAWNINMTAWNLGELRRLRKDITGFEAKLNSRPSGVSEKDFSRLLAGITFYNEIIARRTYSWLGLLDQMEAATPEGIALSALVPDRKTGILKIEGRTKTFAQLKTYLDTLEDSKFFTAVMLLSHTEISVGEKSKGLQFSISCKAALQ